MKLNTKPKRYVWSLLISSAVVVAATLGAAQ